MVWELALPGERVVRIEEFAESSHHHDPSPLCCCIGSKARIPTLLHVSREARDLALKHYTVTFKNRLRQPTYFNPNLDILFFASVDDFIKFARSVAYHDILKAAKPSLLLPRCVHYTHNILEAQPRPRFDNEKIEKLLKHVAIGRSNPLEFHQVTGKTPWEEISGWELIFYLGDYSNLENLFLEGIYFEDLGLLPAPPPSAYHFIKGKLDSKWEVAKDVTRDLPKITVVGSTKMKQMRFKARESRLWSGARLAEYLL